MPVETEARQTFERVLADQVGGGATSVELIGPAIPNGKRIMIEIFGGSDVGNGDGVASLIALQWGANSNWKTIRGFGLSSSAFEAQIDQELVGNGTKRLRVVRQNNSALTKPIIAWVRGFEV